MYEVHVLFDGYCHLNPDGSMFANCSCTLIKGDIHNIIVDTLTPWDGQKLTDALRKHAMSCDDIDFVISTHGHSDHVGNNNLFLKAIHMIGRSMSYKQLYYDDSKFFNENGVFKIDDYVRVVSTPGHTLNDVSVIVQTATGSVGIVGDLFEREDDLTDESIWINAGSENPESQRRNRKLIMDQVDWIIPGHGAMFSTEKYK